MTVGIFFSNGIEAIVLCDEMVTIRGRQSASVTKMGVLVSDSYNGVLIGAGDGNAVFGAIDSNEGKKLPPTLDACVEEIRGYLASRIDREDKQWLGDQMGNAVNKAGILDPGDTRRFIDFEREKILQMFDARKQKQSRNPSTQMVVAAYDKADEKVRSFVIADSYSQELFMPHKEIGSGSDAAELYFLENLQGLDTRRMDLGELAFWAASAYMKSTLNVGVGGTPTITMLGKNGSVKLGSLNSAFLTNVCGHYMSGALSADKMNAAVAAIINADQDEMLSPSLFSDGYRAASYEGKSSRTIDLIKALWEVSEETKASPGELFGATIPYSVFQQRAHIYRRT